MEELGAELGAVLWRQLAGWHVSAVLMMFSLLVSVARGDIEVRGGLGAEYPCVSEAAALPPCIIRASPLALSPFTFTRR
ncbi:hypothetical protein E2C01_020987 [Portunus trituberculatus]|uniref:Uncharacterized protein n=1 Tax=Portunus trituberculatus TaxID=210409 RepID=A0A5B7E3H1_PORTR|nr:hypothetical protein [Portunus trituberculatus]